MPSYRRSDDRSYLLYIFLKTITDNLEEANRAIRADYSPDPKRLFLCINYRHK